MMMVVPRSGDPQERTGEEVGSVRRASSRFSPHQDSTVEAGVVGSVAGPGSGDVGVAAGCDDGDHHHPEAARRWHKKAYPGEVFPLPFDFR